MLNRIRNIIKLSGKDQQKLAELTDEQIDSLPDEGNGNAVFLGEGSHEEFEEQERADKGFIGKIFGA